MYTFVFIKQISIPYTSFGISKIHKALQYHIFNIILSFFQSCNRNAHINDYTVQMLYNSYNCTDMSGRCCKVECQSL